MEHWSRQYLNLRIPYSPGECTRQACDCWGFVRLVYQEKLNIVLPDLPAFGSMEWAHRSASMRESCWKQVEKPFEFCAVGMARKDVLHHVGVWTEADGGCIVHAVADRGGLCTDTLKTLRLRGIRVFRYYRWHGLDY